MDSVLPSHCLVRSSLILILATTALLLPDTAFAEVNMKDAEFSTTFTDLKTPEVEISRTYNSRSLESGYFGFGWCSLLDLHITPQGLGWILKECGREIAFKHRVQKNAVGSSVFTARNPKDGQLEILETSLILRRSDGSEFAFNLSGVLEAWTRPGGEKITIRETQQGLIRELSGKGGWKVRLFVDRQRHRVERIEASNGMTCDYVYQGEDLLEVRNAWKNIYRYHTNSFHNLVHIAFPDGTSETITYDNEADRVTSYTGRNHCTENYQYEVLSSDRLHFSATATKECPDQPLETAHFEFWHRRSVDGKIFLAKTRIQHGTQNVELIFDATTGESLTKKRGLASQP
jgi:hypothetical protein